MFIANFSLKTSIQKFLFTVRDFHDFPTLHPAHEMKVLALRESVEYAPKNMRRAVGVESSRGTQALVRLRRAKDMKQQTPERTGTPPVAQPSNNRSIDTATLELLRSWQIQDATDNPEEVRAAEEEISAFKRAMNENRTVAGEPLLYP